MSGARHPSAVAASPGPRLGSLDAPPGAAGRGAPLRVLLVEDSAADAELLGWMLRDGDPAAFELTHVARLSEARAALAERAPDVVLLDLSLPDGHGLESLAAIRAAAPAVPVVVMTGLADDGVALDAVHEGAQDYLVKGRDDAAQVQRAVRYAVERHHLVLTAQRAVAARDELLAIVSHDLRNPLAAVAMCARALQDPEPPTPDGAREMGELIERSCDWMQRLIRDLLDAARLEAGTLRLAAEPLDPWDVVEAVRALYAPIAADRGVALATTGTRRLPRVHGDADRLTQAIGNLLDNALKFTPAGGTVTLGVDVVRPDDAGGATFVRCSVADTGCGIAPAHLAHVFDRYWQAQATRRDGAGLGLAIARGVVEAHGGRIAVESVVERGTTFTCTIPALA